MIDIINANKAFDKYVKNYDPRDKKIKLKIDHIKRVSEISKELAMHLELSEEDIQLAELIGLLHDIGRFEQIKRYNTFNDFKSVNHGEFGANLLFKEGLIRKFIVDNQYDEIIRTAIINHNQRKIEDGLNDRDLLHSKIIRDSDKTDIFYVILTEDVQACYETNNMAKEIITPEIFMEFVEEHCVDYANRKSSADTLVCHFAYVFDYNFNYSLEILQRKNYIDKLYKRIKFEDNQTQQMCDKVYEITKKYMNTKINNKQGDGDVN